MKKSKKVLVSFGTFVVGLVSKTFAVIEPKYGIQERDIPTTWDKILIILKKTFIIPIILFIIGVFVILSKKIHKKAKLIIILILFIIELFCIRIINSL